MKKALSLLLGVCVSSAAATAQSSPRVGALGVGVGLVAAGSDDDASGFAAGFYGQYTAWITPLFGIGAEAVLLSAFDTNCDPACNAKTRAVGGALRAAVRYGTANHPSEFEVGASAGPFRGRYSRQVVGGTIERNATVLGGCVNVKYSPPLFDPIRPMFALRGTALPDRFGSRARFVTLSLGFRIS